MAGPPSSSDAALLRQLEQLNMDLEKAKADVEKAYEQLLAATPEQQAIRKECYDGFTKFRDDLLKARTALEAKLQQGVAGAAGAAGGEGAAPRPSSSGLELPARLTALPSNADEVAQYLNDFSAVRVPMNAVILALLRACGAGVLQWAVLAPTDSLVAAHFTSLMDYKGENMTSEQNTTVMVHHFVNTVFALMHATRAPAVAYELYSNKAETGTTSSVVEVGKRPDRFLVANSCTLFAGEDKRRGDLMNAVADLATKLTDLHPLHYGDLPFLLLLAAAGTEVQWFVKLNNQAELHQVSNSIDINPASGRLLFILTLIKAYDLLQAMAMNVKPLPHRFALFKPYLRHEGTTIRFEQQEVTKSISDFKAYAERYNTSLTILKSAYAAASAAKLVADAQGKSQCLVTADGEPEMNRHGKYTVRLTPIGYRSPPKNEEELKAMAQACCRAAEALHATGIVHRDLRWENVVRLMPPTPPAWMVIDLEHAAKADTPVQPSSYLKTWKESTLDERTDGTKVYSCMSDMHHVGLLLQGIKEKYALHASSQAEDFMQRLVEKQLTAVQALSEPWLTNNAQEGD